MLTAAEVYRMLANESVWDVAVMIDRALTSANIPYAVCGGVAVCLHGYQRNTVDVDLVVRGDDGQAIRELLRTHGFAWDENAAEFRFRGVPVHILTAGSKAGRDTTVRIAEPVGAANVETLEGLSALRLSRLIEMKIACGLGNPRRTHKDFADVVELIAVRGLDGSFTRFLHRSLRETFCELLRCASADDRSQPS